MAKTLRTNKCPARTDGGRCTPFANDDYICEYCNKPVDACRTCGGSGVYMIDGEVVSCRTCDGAGRV